MRKALRLIVLASVAGIVIGCSSGDKPSTTPNVVSSGGGGDGDSHQRDGSAPAGSSDSSATGDPPKVSDASVPFRLTSSAFVDGASIPVQYTCNGTNESPPLAWTPGPVGTKSYAVVLTDRSNELVHSVIYDIRSNVLSLDAGVQKVYAPPVPAGAHQTKAGFVDSFGYAGPCPPQEHHYEFVVHALDVAILPDASAATTTKQAKALIDAHSLGTAVLGGKYHQ